MPLWKTGTAWRHLVWRVIICHRDISRHLRIPLLIAKLNGSIEIWHIYQLHRSCATELHNKASIVFILQIPEERYIEDINRKIKYIHIHGALCKCKICLVLIKSAEAIKQEFYWEFLKHLHNAWNLNFCLERRMRTVKFPCNLCTFLLAGSVHAAHNLFKRSMQTACGYRNRFCLHMTIWSEDCISRMPLPTALSFSHNFKRISSSRTMQPSEPDKFF